MKIIYFFIFTIILTLNLKYRIEVLNLQKLGNYVCVCFKKCVF